MAVLESNFQRFDQTTAINGGSIESIETQNHGSRSVLGNNDSNSAGAWIQWGCGWSNRHPTITTSSAASKRAGLGVLGVSFATLALPAGTEKVFAQFTITNTYNATEIQRLYFYIKNDSGAYKIIAKCVDEIHSVTETSELGVVTAGSTFYAIKFRIWLDKIDLWLDGVAKTAVTFDYAMTAIWLYAQSLYFPDPHLADPKFDRIYLNIEEQNTGTTLTRIPLKAGGLTGKVVMIKAAALTNMIGAGTAFKYSLSAGAFTEAVTADKNYVAAMVLEDGATGYAEKLNKSAGGVWSKSDFAIG